MMKLLFLNISFIFLTMKMKIYFFNMLNILMIFLLWFYLIIKNLFFNNYWILLYYNFGMDYLSFSLILLILWIISLSMMSNKKYLNFLNNKFSIIMLILMLMLILTLISLNMLIFYIFFEISLIPILLIIMGWGFQIDRIQASMYMMFYTLVGSLPLLLMILLIFKFNKSLMFNILKMNNMYMYSNFLFYIMLNLGFFIKMPMYFLHLWLPKAHVEAPISGSMILAGIMLKLGSYGIYRFMLIFPKLYLNFNQIIIIISLIGSLLASLICLNQSDMKIIVAYSSIVHMNLMLSSMMTLFNLSFKGSILMMIGHGLCSPGMFFLVNLIYERIKSRNIFINKNLINILPSLTMWWFLIYSSNFSAPPSLNLFSEILLFISLIQWNFSLIFFIMLISFFSTCYSIFIYAFSQYGNLNNFFYNFKKIDINEFFIIIMHWLPLNLLFFNMNLLIF